MSQYVGLDVSLKETSVCVLDASDRGGVISVPGMVFAGGGESVFPGSLAGTKDATSSYI